MFSPQSVGNRLHTAYSGWRFVAADPTQFADMSCGRQDHPLAHREINADPSYPRP